MLIQSNADLLTEARLLNKKIKSEITQEVIAQLSLFLLEYNGDINYLLNKIDIISKLYPL